MAASTRSSWMPRWRSCRSTMEKRSVENGSAPLPLIRSLFAPPDVHIKSQHAVLVSHSYDGDILINVVFHLDHRLRRLREAGDVSKGDVVVDLLFNGHARAWVIFRADELRIDGHTAAAGKEPLHPVTESRIQGFAKNRIGSRGCVGALSRLGRAIEGLIARSPKGQQGDDVTVGERRIGTIRHAESFSTGSLAMQANSDIIALDPGRHIKVYDRLDTERIAEGNVATLQAVLGPFKVDITFGNVHPAHNCRPRCRSAHVQIKIAGEL